MKVLPLYCKRLDPREARMTTLKNSVPNYHIRAKYIDTQLKRIFLKDHCQPYLEKKVTVVYGIIPVLSKYNIN